MDPISIGTGAKAAGTLIATATDPHKRKLAANLWKTIRRRLRGGKVGIGIFGAGGVGKTTLGTFLDEKFDPLALAKPYKSSPDTETYYLKSNDAQSLFVAPGQDRRRQYRYTLIDQLSRYKRVVLINVVAYGYHATEEPVSDYAQYLSVHRELEQSEWEELLASLKTFQVPLIVVTLVTKQDLWWDKQEEVKNHYESGIYTKTLTELQSIKGQQYFSHEFLYTALTIQNLKDSTDKPLALTVAGYDSIQQYEAQRRVGEVLERLTK